MNKYRADFTSAGVTINVYNDYVNVHKMFQFVPHSKKDNTWPVQMIIAVIFSFTCSCAYSDSRKAFLCMHRVAYISTPTLQTAVKTQIETPLF